MEYKVRLNKYGHINNSYPYKARALNLWKEVENFFVNYDLLTYYSGKEQKNGFKVTLNAEDVKDFYKSNINDTGFDEYGFYYGDPNCYLGIEILGNNNSEVYHIGQGYNIINKFLQDLFFTMNIIVPGSFELYGSEFYDDEYESLDRPTVSLSSFFLIESYIKGKEWKYPKYSNLKINNVWKWVNRIQIPGVSLAKNDAQKAVFTILNLSRGFQFTPEHILVLSRGYEALLGNTTNSIIKSLKEKISLILKEPDTNKKWISEFYNNRSRIIHGELPIPRGSDGYEFENQDFLQKDYKNFLLAKSVFISVIHDLIKNKSIGYSFNQKIHRIKDYT